MSSDLYYLKPSSSKNIVLKTQQSNDRPKRKVLSKKERTKANLLRLPKTGWDYENLEAMRQLWIEYMKDNVSSINLDVLTFGMVLAKSEYVGADVTIIRSKTPSLIGQSGTVVLETKNSIQIVTKQNKLKIIPKVSSVFSIIFNGKQFTMFGKRLMQRSGDRSNKIMKSLPLPDL